MLTHSRFLLLLGLVLAFFIWDPALAGNKFEKISSGVTGSFSIKRDFIKNFFFAASGVFVLGSILAFTLPHQNALMLNYSGWKKSGIIMAVLALLFLVAALLI